MKKIMIIPCLLFLMNLQLIKAQSTTDIGRIILNSLVIDVENKLPVEAKSFLETKLTRIASDNSVGGVSINTRFVIAAKINLLSTDAIPGPPQMIALNTEITFFVGDAISNQIYATQTISSKGVGINENKALIDAIKNINTKNPLLITLIENGKNKIVGYYDMQCDFIIKKSKTLAEKQDFDAAIDELMKVPNVCKECFNRCLETVQPIYKKKIDSYGYAQLSKARNIWNANQNSTVVSDVASLLGGIEPMAACYNEAVALSETIKKKIEKDEKKEWDFKMRQYNDNIKQDKQIIEASKAVAVAYAKNQPNTIIYNHLIW